MNNLTLVTFDELAKYASKFGYINVGKFPKNLEYSYNFASKFPHAINYDTIPVKITLDVLKEIYDKSNGIGDAYKILDGSTISEEFFVKNSILFYSNEDAMCHLLSIYKFSEDTLSYIIFNNIKWNKD